MSLLPPIAPLLSPPPANPPPTSNSSTITSPPPTSQPNTPPVPPPQSPPPVPVAPPPSPPLSLPPTVSPPPPTVSSPPVLSPPPSPPALQPPSPPSTVPPPAIVTSPPPSIPSPPPPIVVPASPPPQPSPSSPEATPPPAPSQAAPAPPADNAPPPSPSESKPPKSSHSPPAATPPPSDSPPATTAPPQPSTLLPPPPPQSVPSTSSPPTISPPAPSSNVSNGRTPSLSPLPIIPTEKPTAKSTDGTTSLTNSTSSRSSSRGLNSGGAITVGILVGFVVLSLLAMAVWFVRKRKRKDSGTMIGYSMPYAFSSPQSSDVAILKHHSVAPHIRSASGSEFVYSPSDSGLMSNQRSWFSYEELIEATNGFSSKNLLGEGGFGCVYKGILNDGTEVAVKQLKIGGSQGEREFRAEVEIITRVHHRHLVTLVGYCISQQHRLLVYDYVPNDTLHYHLHGKGRPVMAWATRVRVAAGAARGIAYLHEDCHPRIIHRDIKSSNILLDNNFEAQVADFGLARIAQELDATHVSTRVMGTFGYMAPEYAASGKLTEKSDVYSFGVVLLELITGRKPVDDSQPLGDESLVEWARPLLTQALEHEEFEELVDPKLANNYVPNEMFRMIEAAAACVRHSAAKRPKMSQVVRAFDTLEEIADITNGMRPGQSQVFDSRQQSAQIKMFQRMAFGSQDYSSGFFNQSQSSWGSHGSSDYGSRDHGGRRNYIP